MNGWIWLNQSDHIYYLLDLQNSPLNWWCFPSPATPSKDPARLPLWECSARLPHDAESQPDRKGAGGRSSGGLHGAALNPWVDGFIHGFMGLSSCSIRNHVWKRRIFDRGGSRSSDSYDIIWSPRALGVGPAAVSSGGRNHWNRKSMEIRIRKPCSIGNQSIDLLFFTLNIGTWSRGNIGKPSKRRRFPVPCLINCYDLALVCPASHRKRHSWTE